MTGWKERASGTLLVAKHAALDARNAKVLARTARETDGVLPERPAGGAMAGGDKHAMRGVPIQARGVGGTVRGTDPHAAVGYRDDVR